MGRISNLQAELTGYLDEPIPGQKWTGYGVQHATKAFPLGGTGLFDLLNRVRAGGHTVTLVTEGPDVQEAMRRVEELLEQPATPTEALVLGPLWFMQQKPAPWEEDFWT